MDVDGITLIYQTHSFYSTCKYKGINILKASVFTPHFGIILHNDTNHQLKRIMHTIQG